MEKKQELTKALQIGTVCIFSYLASYYMRHLLSVTTPGMLETGLFTKDAVASLSSVYFLIYAFGQLINGTIGDHVKPKNMVLIGLTICGGASILFTFVGSFLIQMILFGLMGFALSMLRGPLVKTISENTLPRYARICCVFFSFSSFAGPVIASLLAMFFDWRMTFIVAGLSCVAIGVCAYTVLTVLEKKGVIQPVVSQTKKEKKRVWDVFRLEHFVFYMFIGALVEISTASIGFWLPTYLTERLAFDKDTANFIFSGISLIRSFAPFGTLFVLKLFRDDDVRMVQYSFLSATLFFIGVWLVKNPYLNVLLFLLGLMSASCASALLWSVYIPSQGKSGMVSTVNGVLDFSGYAASSVVNKVTGMVQGWNGIVIMWMVMMASGVVAAVITKRKKG